MEATTEVADGREASSIADFGDSQTAFAQQFCGTAQADGADELCGLLACGGLYLPV